MGSICGEIEAKWCGERFVKLVLADVSDTDDVLPLGVESKTLRLSGSECKSDIDRRHLWSVSPLHFILPICSIVSYSVRASERVVHRTISLGFHVFGMIS